MSKVKYPSIPAPSQDIRSIQATVIALKEAVELLTGQRQNVNPPVTWDDLVRLGVIEQGDVPR